MNIVDTQPLENSLNACTLRHQVIADNIANANTPGYRAKAVRWESSLREALESGEPIPARAEVVTQAGKMSIHNEMVSLAKNQIMYNALITKISGSLALTKWVIENSGR